MGTRGRKVDRRQVDRTLKAWRASGLSARKYAEQQGLSVTTLNRWNRRYGAADELEFAPVVVTKRQPPPASAGFIVELTDGVKVGVPLGFDDGELRRLLGVLGEGARC